MPMQPLRRALLGAALRARHRPAGRRAKRLSRQAGDADRALSCRRLTDRHLRIVAQDASGTWASPSSWKTGRAPAARWGRPTCQDKPDGYTISLYTLAMLRMPYMHKTNWDPINDFTFIVGLSGYTFGFTVRADSPYRTFNDYIEAARKAPAASTTQLDRRGLVAAPADGEVARNAGVQLNHVPFKGNADMQQALLGGHVMAQSDATGWDQFVDAGKMRLLVTFGEQRTTRWPDVPTAQELGQVVSTSPYGLAGPKGMDPVVVRTLHDAFKRALYDPAAWR